MKLDINLSPIILSRSGMCLVYIDAFTTKPGTYRTWLTMDGLRIEETVTCTVFEDAAQPIGCRLTVRLEAGRPVALAGEGPGQITRARLHIIPLEV